MTNVSISSASPDLYAGVSRLVASISQPMHTIVSITIIKITYFLFLEYTHTSAPMPRTLHIRLINDILRQINNALFTA